MKIKVVGINARFTHSCLALFYVRNQLEDHLGQAEVSIHQYTINDPYYQMAQDLLAGGADYYFISTLIWNSDLVERLIPDILSVDEHSTVVVGGPQATMVGRNFTGTERVCIFAGDIEAAPDDFYRDLASGRVQKSYHASFLKHRPGELESPYRGVDFASQLKNRYIYYESSRGCPFSCTYCLSSSEKGLYHKDLQTVFQELDEILVHEPKSLRFVDRTFNDLPERALKIWQNLAARDCSTQFHFEIAPDRFTDEILSFLGSVRPGLFEFEIGIQSTHARTLQEIQRPIDTAQAAANIKRLRQMENIHLHVDLILGLPYDTAKTFRDSLNDVFRMRPHYIQMGLLKLLPETRIRSQAETYGFKWSSRPPYPVFANRWMDGESLRHLFWLGECLERLFNNRYFVTFWDYLVRQGEDMALFFEQAAETFHENDYFTKATTQETLGGILLAQVEERADYPLLRELLCYDWLRCGHRFLPDYLDLTGSGLNELRRELYRLLPEELENVYDSRSRAHFIKKSVFQRFTPAALEQAGHRVGSSASLVCFTPEREPHVFRFNKTLTIAIND